MSNPVITINRFECLSASCTWTDENGDPVDLTGKTITVVDYSPAVLGDMAATVTDAANGVFTLKLDEDDAAQLPSGMNSWFRLSLNTPGGCDDSTPRIGINVE